MCTPGLSAGTRVGECASVYERLSHPGLVPVCGGPAGVGRDEGLGKDVLRLRAQLRLRTRVRTLCTRLHVCRCVCVPTDGVHSPSFLWISARVCL